MTKKTETNKNKKEEVKKEDKTTSTKKKSSSQKSSDSKKTSSKKTDSKKTGSKKTESKKTDDKKTDSKKKKSTKKKSDPKKSDQQKKTTTKSTKKGDELKKQETKVVVKQVSKEESPILSEEYSTSRLTKLAFLISGEKKIEEERKELEKLKEEAKRDQKDRMRKDIKDHEVMLSVDPEYIPGEIEATAGARKVIQKINLYKWEAPIRVQFPFDTKVFTTVVIISLFFILYLAVLGHYGLMFSIIALLFFLYVAGTTEALNVTHSITTRGIDTLDKLYEWYMLRQFRFTKKNDEYLIIVETRLRTPAKLIMLLDKEDITPVFLLLQDKLLYKDMRKQGWLDKATYGEYIRIEDI